MIRKLLRFSALILLFFSPVLSINVAQGLFTPFTHNPPVIDGIITGNEWTGAPVYDLPHGYLIAKHDSDYIYILIDLIGDTGEDNPPSPQDYFWLTFDVDQDKAITSNIDLNYGVIPDTFNLAVQKYLAPGTWTGLSPTSSILGAGFGPSHISAIDHRFWEFAIDKQEVDAGSCRLARIGVKMNSTIPSFDDDVPENFSIDFTDLIELSCSEPVAGILEQENLAPTYLTGLLFLFTTVALLKKRA